MKIIKERFAKRLLSTLLILCMMLPLLPVPTYAANTGVTWIKINGQKLDGTNKYLVGGVVQQMEHWAQMVVRRSLILRMEL